MKIKKLLTALPAFFFLVNVGLGQTIVGSAHDFSTQTWNTTQQICICCHTPHNADITVPDAPLWNHKSTTATFQLYTSPTFNGSATITQPSGSSKLCLSCHDGTVALENFGGTTNGTHFISTVNNVGTDLRNDHPISFIYDAALAAADPGLWNPTTHPSGIGSGTITATMLFNNKLECASCHNVHNGTGIAHLLRKTNVGSALCLTCHNK
ncbi:MAG: cytochrome c3 family protein [Bacteroidota bacterium]